MRPPNILLFLPDGVPASAMEAPERQTPHMDRLAARGVTFTRAHCPLPTCSPSRASLMTGLLPHNHGVLQVEHCVDEDQSVLRRKHPHWAQRLVEKGYRTGYFGKWHVERSERLDAYGWQTGGANLASAHRRLGAGVSENERALIAPGNLIRYEEGPEGYRPILHYAVTDLPAQERPLGRITAQAANFLDDVISSEEPWACCVSFSEPNTPVVCGRAAFDRIDPERIQLPPSLGDPMLDRPALYRRIQQIYRSVSEHEWRELRAAYFGLISEIDEQLGLLLHRIESAGQLDRTVVVFTSDHGRYLGGHGLDAHNFGAFEDIYRIPLCMAGPGIQTGVPSRALVGLHDLGPTLLELAGAAALTTSDSRSFACVLGDPGASDGDFDVGYAEYHGTRFPLMQRVLWQGSWKFVFNGFDEDELYDLASDPHEMKNRASDPRECGRMRAMMARMWHEMKRTNDRALLETHYSPMRFGAVGPLSADANST